MIQELIKWNEWSRHTLILEQQFKKVKLLGRRPCRHRGEDTMSWGHRRDCAAKQMNNNTEEMKNGLRSKNDT